MRLKNNPKAKAAIAESDMVIKDPAILKNTWKDVLTAEKPIYIEIGCGKGQFLCELSKNNPDKFFIGIEQYESVLFSAIKKVNLEEYKNLRFLCVRAEYLEDYFETNEVDHIFLNFSDPWPKKRHYKRRLSSDRFLSIYHNILKRDGKIEMKTDNKELFEFSLESFGESKYFVIEEFTWDLYSDTTLLSGNVATEYETKFHSEGKPICKLIARHL